MKITSVDEYIASMPEETQMALEEIRAVIKTIAPNAEEQISYKMPAFKVNGDFFIHFSAWKNHIGMYPIPAGNDAFQKEIEPYRSAKSSLNFPLNKPMPLKLIRKVVKFRIAENLEKTRTKPVKKKVLPVSRTDKVDEFLQELSHPLKAEVEAVRSIIKGVNKDINEEIKWKAPSFSYRGEYLVTFNLWETKRIHLVFHNSKVSKVKSPLLEGDYADRRMAYFADMKDIKAKKSLLQKALKDLIKLQ